MYDWAESPELEEYLRALDDARIDTQEAALARWEAEGSDPASWPFRPPF